MTKVSELNRKLIPLALPRQNRLREENQAHQDHKDAALRSRASSVNARSTLCRSVGSFLRVQHGGTRRQRFYLNLGFGSPLANKGDCLRKRSPTKKLSLAPPGPPTPLPKTPAFLESCSSHRSNTIPVKQNLSTSVRWKQQCTWGIQTVHGQMICTVHSDHPLLHSAPNLGPLISRWEINKFENCGCKSVRILEVLKLLSQQFFNLSSSQWNMSGPILGDLSNNRWSGGNTKLTTPTTWVDVDLQPLIWSQNADVTSLKEVLYEKWNGTKSNKITKLLFINELGYLVTF
jgi:hypothetical protein